MKTGEGKTLVATLPAYLNALTGKGVHIVTVNDYLAKRDSEWMGKVYRFLGLTVGLIVHDLTSRAAPRRLRLPTSPTAPTTSSALTTCATTWSSTRSSMVQRGHDFAIVDEVDSILIDEARTPLIISGQGDKSTDLYEHGRPLCPRPARAGRRRAGRQGGAGRHVDGDYIVDEKDKTATLTAQGVAQGRGVLRRRKPRPTRRTPTLQHHINQAIKAHGVMKRDVDYVVQGRRGHHRRRVHRPPDVRPPLQRGPAPGHRGQGGRQGRAREQDAGHHHLPELLPHVRQALRHDRYRHDRGRGVPGASTTWTSWRSPPTSP